MLRRIGIALGAVAASLALAASAQAATTPIMNPIPAYVCASSVNVSWTPSSPDAGGSIVSYRVDIGDLTAGTATYKYTSALSTVVSGLIHGHQYVVRVRSLQYKNGALTYSSSSGRTFRRLCLISPEVLNRYVAYNPFPECIMCDRLSDILQIEDPIVYRRVSAATLPAAERFQGMQLEADGSVVFG
jgi:hypothetical protein